MSETDTEIVEQAQKQEIDSSIVVLWEIQLKGDEYVHFHAGVEADLSTVQFRDREDSSIINSYTALPVAAEGFEVQSDGAAQRPTITFANVLSTFGDALQLEDGTVLTNKDLLGKKVYRRRTLYKYCYGQSGDSPDRSIEYPIQMYFVDRIATETPELIVFELASGYDLAGIMTPRRVITGNSCSWIYTGAAPEKTVAERIGGCTWSEYGKIPDRLGTIQTVYFNKKDDINSIFWIAQSLDIVSTMILNVNCLVMDTYLLGRMMKDDYKNIIIYAGEYHINEYRYFLSKFGKYKRESKGVPKSMRCIEIENFNF